MSARVAIAAVSGATVAALVACAGVSELAPPADGPVLTAAEARGLSAESVARGRALVVGECARCHRPVAPATLSESEWRDTVARMARKAGVTPEQATDVLAYELAARQASIPASR